MVIIAASLVLVLVIPPAHAVGKVPLQLTHYGAVLLLKGLVVGLRKRVEQEHCGFLSAAQPTDQGEESVVLLLVVVGGNVLGLPRKSFWGVKRQKLCIKRV